MAAEEQGRIVARRQITHVIFDLDGLLLDTEKLYTVCTQDILNRYGKVFDWSIKSRMMGRRPLEATQVLVDALSLPLTAEEFNKELYSKLDMLFPEAELMPGALELVTHLHRNGIPLAVATGSATGEYRAKTSKQKEMESCFSHAVCSDHPELKRGKPAPDVFLLAAKKFNPPPASMDQVLVFEDAPNGVAAGKAAGMFVIMVPDHRTSKDSTKQADRVVQSLEKVDLAEFGLPPLV